MIDWFTDLQGVAHWRLHPHIKRFWCLCTKVNNQIWTAKSMRASVVWFAFGRSSINQTLEPGCKSLFFFFGLCLNDVTTRVRNCGWTLTLLDSFKARTWHWTIFRNHYLFSPIFTVLHLDSFRSVNASWTSASQSTDKSINQSVNNHGRDVASDRHLAPGLPSFFEKWKG